MNIRHKAKELFNIICRTTSGQTWRVNSIMEAFEDVAVDFAWEILEAFKCGAGTTRSALKLSFDDYLKERRILQYPSYKAKTQYDEVFHAKDIMSIMCPKCHHTFLGRNHCPKCYWEPFAEYRTDVEITRERMKAYEKQHHEEIAKLKRAYDDKKYGYVARPGIDLDDGDPDKRGLPVSYISPEDAKYLWGCMPGWIKDGPGDKDMKVFCTWYGTLSYEGDLKVHNEVKRILNR